MNGKSVTPREKAQYLVSKGYVPKDTDMDELEEKIMKHEKEEQEKLEKKKQEEELKKMGLEDDIR